VCLALDHTRILGHTVEEILQKKCGIFKRGSAALIGYGLPEHVAKVRPHVSHVTAM